MPNDCRRRSYSILRSSRLICPQCALSHHLEATRPVFNPTASLARAVVCKPHVIPEHTRLMPWRTKRTATVPDDTPTTMELSRSARAEIKVRVSSEIGRAHV